jgi:hypothetical protein
MLRGTNKQRITTMRRIMNSFRKDHAYTATCAGFEKQ